MSEKQLLVFTISEQSDGNWIGTTVKDGKEISVREVKPEDCLLRMITHP